MRMGLSAFGQSTIISKSTTLFLHHHHHHHNIGIRTVSLSIPFLSFSSSFSTSSPTIIPTDTAHHHHKWRRHGGVKVSKQEIVRDDPTNNVPDTIFWKLGLQLHRRDQHPLGILKNAIYEYFDANYPNKFEKFDDLCPIVSIKQNFDDVLVPANHISRKLASAGATGSRARVGDDEGSFPKVTSTSEGCN